MIYRHKLLQTLFLLVASWPLMAPATAQPATKLQRQLDPVVVRDTITQPLWGRDIERLRVYAFEGSAWRPIPFQIDKVDADGNYAIAFNSIPDQVRDEVGLSEVSEQARRAERIEAFEATRPALLDKVARNTLSQQEFEELVRRAYLVEDPATLDYNDELVFMARDAGNRAARERWLAKDAIEIELSDPLDGSRAWVYLFYFTNDPPPRSVDDYVDYDPEADAIISRRLEIAFNRDKPMIIERLVGRPPGEAPLPDVLDRFKLQIRIKPRILFCVTLDFDENNTRAFTAGYKDGPVRVIRRNIFWIVIGGVKLPGTPKMTSYLTAYEYGLSSRAEYQVPVDLNWFLCKGSSFKAGLDLLETSYGAQVFTKDNPIGAMAIDGTMSRAERRVQKKDQRWIAGYLPNRAALISRVLHDERMIELGATLDLVFEDDASRHDDTETEPGQHFVGHTLDLKRFPAGTYRFGFQIYTAFGFDKGDVEQLLNIDDHPLLVRDSTP